MTLDQFQPLSEPHLLQRASQASRKRASMKGRTETLTASQILGLCLGLQGASLIPEELHSLVRWYLRGGRR